MRVSNAERCPASPTANERRWTRPVKCPPGAVEALSHPAALDQADATVGGRVAAINSDHLLVAGIAGMVGMADWNAERISEVGSDQLPMAGMVGYAVDRI